METKINTAIWIDSDKAYILNLENGNQQLQKVQSEVEHHVRYEGESDSASRFGSQQIDKKKKVDERRKHQEHDYFKNIIKFLPNPDGIMICGPSMAKKGLEKEINNIKSMSGKIDDVLTVDSMTENQIIAYLKNYYK